MKLKYCQNCKYSEFKSTPKGIKLWCYNKKTYVGFWDKICKGEEMKEIIRIEIDTKKCKSCSNECKRKLEDRITCELRNNLTPKLSYEKVPTNWEELKEMCKKINSKIVNENAMYESQIIIDTDKGYFGFYYYSTGRIDIVFKSAYSTNHTVAKRRTIPQTWAFIKSLIGEE